jgi:DNA mismatch repair protein MutS2
MAAAWRSVAPGHREVDLHGMNRGSAGRLVRDALEACRRDGVHRLRVVHGKGTGALRDEVRFVLDSSLLVAEFRTARPRDGGEGAVEVWLEGGPRRGPIRG